MAKLLCFYYSTPEWVSKNESINYMCHKNKNNLWSLQCDDVKNEINALSSKRTLTFKYLFRMSCHLCVHKEPGHDITCLWVFSPVFLTAGSISNFKLSLNKWVESSCYYVSYTLCACTCTHPAPLSLYSIPSGAAEWRTL